MTITTPADAVRPVLPARFAAAANTPFLTPDIHRVGAVGTVTFRVVAAATAPEAGLLALDALATYATIAGFGDRTALGMGHVHLRELTPR